MKLRANGIYRFKEREYQAVLLFNGDDQWGVTCLMDWPKARAMPRNMLYLRHADGVVLRVEDFRPAGSFQDLTDTGRTVDDHAD